MVEIMTGPDGRNLSHYSLIITDNSNHVTYHNDNLRHTTEGLVTGRRAASWCHDAVCSLHSITRESRYATPTLHLAAEGFWHSEICEPIMRTSLLNTKHIVGSQRRQLVSLLISNPSESIGPISLIHGWAFRELICSTPFPNCFHYNKWCFGFSPLGRKIVIDVRLGCIIIDGSIARVPVIAVIIPIPAPPSLTPLTRDVSVSPRHDDVMTSRHPEKCGQWGQNYSERGVKTF